MTNLKIFFAKFALFYFVEYGFSINSKKIEKAESQSKNGKSKCSNVKL